MSSYVNGEDMATSVVLSNGLISLALSGESGSGLDLDDYADNVLTSFHELLIETIDLQLVSRYLNEIEAISAETYSMLTDKSNSVPARKEYLITRVVKAKGIEGFNLLVEALKSSPDAPQQVELGEKLRIAMLEDINTSSSNTSREASPISTGFVSAIGSPLHRSPVHSSPSSANASADEQTPLLADAKLSTNDDPTITNRKKKGRSSRSNSQRHKTTTTSSNLTSSGHVISYGTTNTYLKIVLMGDIKVGKSSLIHRYIHHQFDPDLKPTAGMDTNLRTFSYNSRDYILQLWDIAGGLLAQHALLPAYCKEAVGVVFVYDVQNEYSLYNLEQWRTALNSLVTQQSGHPIPSIMVGTKSDTGVLDGSVVCKQLGIDKYFCVSAKTGENVDEAFEYLIKQIATSELDSTKISHQSYRFDTKLEQTCCCCTIL